MSIVWREAMALGDPVVDADHRHLIDLINGFESAVADDIDHKAVARVLLGLVRYTGEHFQREEELQLQIHYPFHEAHRRGHRDVLRELNVLLSTYSTAEGSVRDRLIRHMAGFLRHWLVDHIIESDLRMKPYVRDFLADKAESARRYRAAAALEEGLGKGEAPHA